jgi:Mycothiol maleylpyruvate isomerase N-terminal domain
MTTTTTDVATITPLAHQEAMRLQAHELERTLRLPRSLDQASWAAATDCPAWDIRAMYQHVLGACEAGASMRETSASSGGRGPTAGGTAGRWKPRCRPRRSATGPTSAPPRSPAGSRPSRPRPYAAAAAPRRSSAGTPGLLTTIVPF